MFEDSSDVLAVDSRKMPRSVDYDDKCIKMIKKGTQEIPAERLERKKAKRKEGRAGLYFPVRHCSVYAPPSVDVFIARRLVAYFVDCVRATTLSV